MNDFISFMNNFWVTISVFSIIIAVLGFVIGKMNILINKISDKKLKKRVDAISLIVLAVFVILAFTSAFIGNCFIAVPNVRSMSVDNAIQTLRELGFDVQPYQDANFENHRGDTVLYQSVEGGCFVSRGSIIYISYKQNVHDDESKDISSSDENEIYDETLSSVNSSPTTSISIPSIVPIHITYNHSANIVNGGSCCYDNGQYYFGDTELKTSKFPSISHQTIIYNGSAYYLNPVGEYLYFTTPNEKDSICRVKKDGNDFEVLYNYPCHELTYYEGWLYFCSNMGGENYYICRMNPVDHEVTILYDCLEWYMSIHNDKIFFCNYDDNHNIYSMNLNGSDCKPIYYGECYDLCIVNDKIYFSQGAQSRQLYRIDLDGSNSTLLRDSYTTYTNYRDDKLYYVDSEGLLCKCNLDGTQSEIVYNLSSYSFVVLLPDKIICSYDRNFKKNIIILET